jgi:hypothetical protein
MLSEALSVRRAVSELYGEREYTLELADSPKKSCPVWETWPPRSAPPRDLPPMCTIDGGAVDRRALLHVDHTDLERQGHSGPALGDVLADPIECDVEGALGDLRRQLAGLGGARRRHLIGDPPRDER